MFIIPLDKYAYQSLMKSRIASHHHNPVCRNSRHSLSFSVILGKSHYVLFNLVSAMQPRMLVTFDTELRPLPVSVRVGQVRKTVIAILHSAEKGELRVKAKSFKRVHFFTLSNTMVLLLCHIITQKLSQNQYFVNSSNINTGMYERYNGKTPREPQ